MLEFKLRTALALLLASAPSISWAQSAVLQGGPFTPGHVPMYIGQGSAQPVVGDSGPASGGGNGVGLKELGLTVRGTGTAPFANAGSGPFGTNLCDYDAPTNSPGGYHFLCLSPNAQGGGLIAYGAGGGATPLPLNVNINGVVVPLTQGASTAPIFVSAIGDVTTPVLGSSLNGIGVSTTFGEAGATATAHSGLMSILSNAGPTPGVWNNGKKFYTSVFGQSYAITDDGGLDIRVTTNAGTAVGNNTLHFAEVPNSVVTGMFLVDLDSRAAIPPGTTVASTTSTTIVMSKSAVSTITTSDHIAVDLSAGEFFGMGTIAAIQTPDSTATAILGIHGSEIDVVADNDAVAYLDGLSVARVNGTAYHGLFSDSAIAIFDSPTSTSHWLCGICYGRGILGEFPIDSPRGVMIGTNPAYPNSAGTAATGIDLRAVIFNDVAIETPGFTVGPSGIINQTGNFPAVELVDTANTATVTNGGAQRLTGLGDGSFAWQLNVAPAGDFSTTVHVFSIAGTGGATATNALITFGTPIDFSDVVTLSNNLVINSAFLGLNNTPNLLSQYSNDTVTQSVRLAKSRSGTIGNQTVVQNGDALGTIQFLGSDGAAFQQGAAIFASVQGSPSTGIVPGNLVFETANGSGVLTEFGRADKDQNVFLGGAQGAAAVKIIGGTFTNQLLLSGASVNPSINVSGSNLLLGSGSALATTATTGFVMFGTMPGLPTGAPSGNGDGAAAITIDKTDHKLCWNEGDTAWKCVLGS